LPKEKTINPNKTKANSTKQNPEGTSRTWKFECFSNHLFS
jgi:hypothetical protein